MVDSSLIFLQRVSFMDNDWLTFVTKPNSSSQSALGG